MKIAWIGTGVMGHSMVLHLHRQGHDIQAYNRSKAKLKDLVELGISSSNTIAECVKEKDVVITMVGYPNDVEDVYEQIFKHAEVQTTLIDMTTSSPSLAKHLYVKALQHDMYLLDAPVSGGDCGAKDGTLSIMVGGDKTVFEKMLPILSCMGNHIYFMGAAGNGQHTKACNQIAIAGAVAAMSEALVYAQNQGLDEQLMLQAIAKGAAGSWQIEHTAPRVLQQDFNPGFYIKHFIKDMHIVQLEMKDQQLHMLNTVCNMYETLAEQGEEDLGTQALIHMYKNKNG